jgi:LIM domain kinase 1
MSPEILMGESFGVTTDIFSLGIIFAEIISRTLADDNHLKRSAPVWMIDANEIRRTANEGAPEAFTQLATDCMAHEPSKRPTMLQILGILGQIETEVAERGDDENTHVGTVKFATGGKRRPGMPPRIPSFSKLVGDGKALQIDTAPERLPQVNDSDDSDDDLEAVLSELDVGLGNTVEGEKEPPYSTSVVRGPSYQVETRANRSNMSSTMTVKPDSPPAPGSTIANIHSASAMTIDTFRTAPEGSALSVAVATIGENDLNSSIRTMPGAIESSSSFMYHRFTMIKPGSKRHSVGITSTRPVPKGGVNKRQSLIDGLSWSPIEFLLGRSRKQGIPGASTPALSTKCDLCGKRLGLGYKTVLECDDCGLR